MTNIANTEYRDESQGRSFVEHLIFVALLLPTFVVLAAAVVSLAPPRRVRRAAPPRSFDRGRQADGDRRRLRALRRAGRRRRSLSRASEVSRPPPHTWLWGGLGRWAWPGRRRWLSAGGECWC